MHVGITFPQTEIGSDLAVVRDFVRTSEASGFSFLMAYDHVVGADSTLREGWSGPYDHTHPFHEPFVLFGWLAGQTSMELVTGVLILPQRQTVLVAKQAAQVDLLTGGHFRLGVGVGWNEVEYHALGVPFGRRGARLEEQVALMRALWTEDIVTFTGEFDAIDRAGILPRSVQRPIPVWMGSRAGHRVLTRVGRMADGWIANLRVGGGFEEALAVVRAAAADAGRDPGAVGIQGVLDAGATLDADDLRRQRDALRTLGATHATVQTMRVGRSPQEHVDVAGQLGAILVES